LTKYQVHQRLCILRRTLWRYTNVVLLLLLLTAEWMNFVNCRSKVPHSTCTSTITNKKHLLTNYQWSLNKIQLDNKHCRPYVLSVYFNYVLPDLQMFLFKLSRVLFNMNLNKKAHYVEPYIL